MPGTEINERAREYDGYDAPEQDIIDSHESVVVVPEIAVHLLRPLEYARGFVWWLSVDNARYIGHEDILNKSSHVTQSHYARNFLANKGISSDMLSDYTVASDFPTGSKTRERIVAYNPAKGAEFYNKIQRALTDVTWVPISGMNKTQVSETLQRASIYLDLGHHPGKDRIPREAALSGAVVVCAKRGSAAVHEDVPIIQKVNPVDTDEVVRLINEIHSDIALALNSQSDYRKAILMEKAIFDDEVKNVFLR
jgi:hypothetical protein